MPSYAHLDAATLDALAAYLVVSCNERRAAERGRARCPTACRVRPASSRRSSACGAAARLAVGHRGQQHLHRQALHRHGAGLPAAGRRARAAHARAARGAGQHAARAAGLQPGLHDARHRDDVPLRGAHRGGDRGLPAAQHAGRARPALPAPVGLRLLGLRVRRRRLLLLALRRPRARRRLVHVPAAQRARALARHQRRLLAARHRLHRDLGHRRRDRAHRRHPHDARARHDARPHADLRVGDAGRRLHDRLRVPGRDRLHRAARARARVRLAVLRSPPRRRPAALAAPLLVLRPSGRLHHLPARRGHGVGDAAHAGRRAAGRPPRRRRSRCSATGFFSFALWAHHMFTAGLGSLSLSFVSAASMAVAIPRRHPGLRMDRHAVARRRALEHADAVHRRLPRHLRDGRPHRRDGRRAAVRLAGARQLLRRRAPALRADRRHGVARLRRAVLLDAGAARPCARRALRPMGLRARVRRLPPRVLPDAHRRPAAACRGASTPTTRASAGTCRTCCRRPAPRCSAPACCCSPSTSCARCAARLASTATRGAPPRSNGCPPKTTARAASRRSTAAIRCGAAPPSRRK